MQAYKIDRINLITYKNQRKKVVKPLRCRYLAKSHIVNCNAQNQNFSYANFRGAIFKKVKFQNSIISGCDFWGTTFNDCDFRGAKISDCVFMACKFRNCDFRGATLNYTTIVNTSLLECKNIDVSVGVKLYKEYPCCTLSEELEAALKTLKLNNNLRKYKLLHISDNKYNQLNIFLLQRRFTTKELPGLLLKLNTQSTTAITTYKRLERQLKKIKDNAIM